jgi:hypothetical protein
MISVMMIDGDGGGLITAVLHGANRLRSNVPMINLAVVDLLLVIRELLSLLVNEIILLEFVVL